MQPNQSRKIVCVRLVVMLLLLQPGTQVSGQLPSQDQGHARLQARPFSLVLIDEKTERTFGPFPYDRSVLARAVESADALGARAVVLKFYLDRPKTAAGDLALAKAMRKVKVILEARLDDAEQEPNDLPLRFFVSGMDPLPLNAISGRSGWIPLPLLSQEASAIGFVDYRTADRVPVIERYQGRLVKSLATCCLEAAFGGNAVISPGISLQIGNNRVGLDELNQVSIEYPAKDVLDYVPFADLADRRTSPDLIRGRIVIIGYDDSQMPTMETPIGKVKLHRAFYYGLMSLHAKLIQNDHTK